MLNFIRSLLVELADILLSLFEMLLFRYREHIRNMCGAVWVDPFTVRRYNYLR